MTDRAMETRTEERPDLRTRLRQVIVDWGLDDPRSDPPHSWRCQHPELSNPETCGHVDWLINDLVRAATPEADTDDGAEMTEDEFGSTGSGSGLL